MRKAASNHLCTYSICICVMRTCHAQRAESVKEPHTPNRALLGLKHPTLGLGPPPAPQRESLSKDASRPLLYTVHPSPPSSPGSAASFLPQTRQPILVLHAFFARRGKESARLMSSRAKECTLPHTKSCISDPPELLINVSLNFCSLLFSLEVCASYDGCREMPAVLKGRRSLPNEISTMMMNGKPVGCSRPPTLKGRNRSSDLL